MQVASPDESRARVIIQVHDAASRKRMQEAVKGADATVTADLPIIDGFAATVPSSALPGLQAAAARLHQDVRIIPDRVVELTDPMVGEAPLQTQLHIATRAVHLQDVWKAGYKGKGIGIAVIDTGIAPHPDFGNRIVAFQDVLNGRTDPYDDRGHGTHVASVAAGDGTRSYGKYTGAAPEASLIGIKVMNSEGKGELSDIIKGIQWAVENRETYNIRVINMSLGASLQGPVSEDPLSQATAEATKAGILVVAAAGNKGPYPGTIDTPAASPNVVAVGATVDYRTPDLGDDKVAWFSGSGPTSYDRFTKPDVIAPGTNIACADANGRYAYDTGTSIASPLVAGMAALMFQAQPTLTPSQVKNMLRQGAHKIRQYDENTQGKGVVQADQTLHLVEAAGKGEAAPPSK
jgi:serine protease AprX